MDRLCDCAEKAKAIELEMILRGWDGTLRSYGFARPEVMHIPRREFDRYAELIREVPGANVMCLEATAYPGSYVFRGVAVLPA